MRAYLTPEQFEAEAAHRMEGFTFTRIGVTPEIEAWRCQKPGTGIFAFDLVFTRWGISMFGDVDGLLFNVGLPQYGIGWLTHQDIGYIHSKLERQCQEREFDLDAVKEYVTRWLCSKLTEIQDHPDKLPAWMDPDGRDLHTRFGDLKAWLTNNKDYPDVLGFLDDVAALDNTHEAYKLLDENTDLLGINDLCDISLDRPDRDLVQRLYMVRRAARAIFEIKQKEAA